MQSKLWSIVLLLGLLLAFEGSFAAADNVEDKPVAVFYSPHQDDELLTMGHAIARYADAGYEVHVVLLTDGANSQSIKAVNRQFQQMALQPMSSKEFSRARNTEFVRSLHRLGVKRENIHFAGFKDGQTTAEEMERIMLMYAKRYPGSEHMAFSYRDDHLDHRNSGLALLELHSTGFTPQVKFYIQNNERHLWEGQFEGEIDKYKPAINEAAAYYTHWDPLRRLYSIGLISVPHDFSLLERDPRSKFHEPYK